jgi:hypothetical protein
LSSSEIRAEYPNSCLKDLIIVPGHASFLEKVNSVPVNPQSDDLWALSGFQKGEPKYYIEHIYRGLDLAASNPESLLVFSGSWTRKESGRWSEAKSYSSIAEQKCNKCVDAGNCQVSKRIALDEWALDSFQNLLGSICTFNSITQRNPRNITMVGWKFKEERFKLHCDSISFPLNKFNYIGVNNPENVEAALSGEINTINQFVKFPFGNREVLLKKREQRNVKKIEQDFYSKRCNLGKVLGYVQENDNAKCLTQSGFSWN